MPLLDQLEEIFTRFSHRKLDWATLRVALDTMGYYVSRVEAFVYEEVDSGYGEVSPWVKVSPALIWTGYDCDLRVIGALP